MAGLTTGLMALDITTLNILKTSAPDPYQRKWANRVEPLRRNGTRLLCTLLIANMLANEAVPTVVVHGLRSFGWADDDWIVVLISTVLVVLFAEIIPQAICTRHGLMVAWQVSYLLWALIWFLAPIVWPLSWFLNWCMGSPTSDYQGIIYRRAGE